MHQSSTGECILHSKCVGENPAHTCAAVVPDVWDIDLNGRNLLLEVRFLPHPSFMDV